MQSHDTLNCSILSCEQQSVANSNATRDETDTGAGQSIHKRCSAASCRLLSLRCTGFKQGSYCSTGFKQDVFPPEPKFLSFFQMHLVSDLFV